MTGRLVKSSYDVFKAAGQQVICLAPVRPITPRPYVY